MTYSVKPFDRRDPALSKLYRQYETMPDFLLRINDTVARLLLTVQERDATIERLRRQVADLGGDPNVADVPARDVDRAARFLRRALGDDRPNAAPMPEGTIRAALYCSHCAAPLLPWAVDVARGGAPIAVRPATDADAYIIWAPAARVAQAYYLGEPTACDAWSLVVPANAAAPDRVDPAAVTWVCADCTRAQGRPVTMHLGDPCPHCGARYHAAGAGAI